MISHRSGQSCSGDCFPLPKAGGPADGIPQRFLLLSESESLGTDSGKRVGCPHTSYGRQAITTCETPGLGLAGRQRRPSAVMSIALAEGVYKRPRLKADNEMERRPSG